MSVAAAKVLSYRVWLRSHSCLLAGIDFSHEPLPLCKVEAVFEVPLRKGVSKEDVVDWGEDELFSAVVFYWNLEDFEDLDLTVGDHSGCEAYIL